MHEDIVHRPHHDKSEHRERTVKAIAMQDDNRQAKRGRNSNILPASSTLWEEQKGAEDIVTTMKTFRTIIDEPEETGIMATYMLILHKSAEHKCIRKIIITIILETRTTMKRQRDIPVEDQDQFIKTYPISSKYFISGKDQDALISVIITTMSKAVALTMSYVEIVNN
ncbi:hypothetical protein SK128_009040 [Halocaridina rubra]|uniref:Uncharacterized protein n=1 Tax=Halocaridina rubra TaxID=373956 RepID=A0AAN8WZ86_HALRR